MKCNHIASMNLIIATFVMPEYDDTVVVGYLVIEFASIKCLSEKKQLVRKLPVLAVVLNMAGGYLHGVDGFLHVCVANPVLPSEKQ